MKANAIVLYKHFCEMSENPIGADSSERDGVRSQAIKSKLDMEERFRTAKKYRDDPEIKELLGEGEKKEEKEEKPIQDGKPKGRNKSS